MQDTLLMIFTGVLTLAVVIQTALFFGMYKAIRRMSEYLDTTGKDLLRNIDNISAKADACLTAIKEVVDGFRPIREKLADTTEIIHRRVIDLDEFLGETTNNARLEILRIQDTIQAASEKAEHTLELLHKGIFAPINEINAITRAVRVAIDVLFRRRNPSRSAQDEEMFI